MLHCIILNLPTIILSRTHSNNMNYYSTTNFEAKIILKNDKNILSKIRNFIILTVYYIPKDTFR